MLVQMLEKYESLVVNLWSKHGCELGSEFSGGLLLDLKIDCLEIFDFLCVFLLPKTPPFEELEMRKGNDAEEYSYTDHVANQRFGIERWQPLGPSTSQFNRAHRKHVLEVVLIRRRDLRMLCVDLSNVRGSEKHE